MKIKKMFSSIVVFVIRTVVSLRYRVEIKGLEDVQRQLKGQKGGILFLPNHPAEMDPIILMSRLWWVYQPRPLVVEHFYRLPGVAFFMRLARALPLPTMDFFANQWKARQVEKAFKKVASELAAGENFLIYPSGRLKHTGLEVLGGASFVHQLLQHSPEAKIVLIRTTGLWGSRFSRALTGSSPALWKVVLEGFKILL
jgi:long-chain-fatty-acid--[acyl-carrier-protein] ligase